MYIKHTKLSETSVFNKLVIVTVIIGM